MQRKDFEIMAPVGSRESLAAAIKSGADSVYFGVGRLNMRAHSACDFDLGDLRDIAQTCSHHGLRSYLTVNTVIYDDDMETMHEIIDAAHAAGITAIIASDVAAMQYCRSIGQEVHLSTQLNISNVEALKFYAQFADVVVLARELNLWQVRHIHEQIHEQHICGPQGEPVRIEMFCHGALCMAVSGKCYLSLQNAGRSANRGECVQICRRGYEVRDAETGTELLIDNKYIMSPRDLKTIRFLDVMVGSGVRVFKIEGRARGPEYVATVVRAYDEALRAVADGTFQQDAARLDRWDAELATVFNRGFWDGYYQGARLGEWSEVYGSKATERKVYCGRCIKYFSKLQVAEFLIENEPLRRGDKILVTGTTTGALIQHVDEIRYDLQPVAVGERGQHISIPVGEKVRPNDRLYILQSRSLAD
jgi:putative protease